MVSNRAGTHQSTKGAASLSLQKPAANKGLHISGHIKKSTTLASAAKIKRKKDAMAATVTNLNQEVDLAATNSGVEMGKVQHVEDADDMIEAASPRGT